MPTFIDAHKLEGFTEEQLQQAQSSPADEFGVTHKNIIYSKEEDKLFCVLDAPSKEAVEKHHHKMGIKCDWINEVKSTA